MYHITNQWNKRSCITTIWNVRSYHSLLISDQTFPQYRMPDSNPYLKQTLVCVHVMWWCNKTTTCPTNNDLSSCRELLMILVGMKWERERLNAQPCHPVTQLLISVVVRAMTLWAVHQQWMAHALNAMHRDASFCSTTIYLHLGALERS